MEVRLEERLSFDNPPKPYWVIVETVTPNGETIEWQGIYSSKESAERIIAAVTA